MAIKKSKKIEKDSTNLSRKILATSILNQTAAFND
jgi:hypothetical protein